MKKFSQLARVLLGAFALAACAAGATEPKRILFVGNSYTGVNNLPQIFREVATSAESRAPEIKSVTPGGKTLLEHLKLPGTLKVIDDGNWDVVVLQGQSQEAALGEKIPVLRTNFLLGAAGLYDRIKTKSPQAKVVLYETWARHTNYWQSPKADRNLGANPTEMQTRIRTAYQRAAAQRKDFVVAPVGDAWELNYQSPAALRLHRGDNSHPEFNGSYLAALVLYATVYHPPKIEVAYHGNLSEADAKKLQDLASQTVKR